MSEAAGHLDCFCRWLRWTDPILRRLKFLQKNFAQLGILLGVANLCHPLAERQLSGHADVFIVEAGFNRLEGALRLLQVPVEVQGQPFVPQTVVVGQVQVLDNYRDHLANAILTKLRSYNPSSHYPYVAVLILEEPCYVCRPNSRTQLSRSP